MRDAQEQAISHHTCYRVKFAPATTVQVLYGPSDSETCDTFGWVVDLPDVVLVDSVTPDQSGDASITFQANGVPKMTQDAVVTLKLTSGDDHLDLRVNASTGTVRTTVR